MAGKRGDADFHGEKYTVAGPGNAGQGGARFQLMFFRAAAQAAAVRGMSVANSANMNKDEPDGY